MKLLTTVALAGLASAAVPDKSKTFIFSYPHHTYTKTIYGVKADFLTTTHMTIERPYHTHTKTFFTWMGHGAPPTDMPDIPQGDDTDSDTDDEEPKVSSKAIPSSSVPKTSSASSTEAPEPTKKTSSSLEETTLKTSTTSSEVTSKAPEKSKSSSAPEPTVSSVSEGGAAAAGLGVGGLAVALLLI